MAEISVLVEAAIVVKQGSSLLGFVRNHPICYSPQAWLFRAYRSRAACHCGKLVRKWDFEILNRLNGRWLVGTMKQRLDETTFGTLTGATVAKETAGLVRLLA
ncbi:hypothetical protein OAG82_01330 [Rubripirellula sp.]|nr:hypothetical protein [Rubripirellula sp.]MDB4422960.1 hypothetical protein [Rhodopirellula sp.]MDB4621475.1 hypothetical protein [Rubripirellula sp.]